MKNSIAMALRILFLFSLSLPMVFAQNTISAFSFDTQEVFTQFDARSATDNQTIRSWPIKINNELRNLGEGSNLSVPLPDGGFVTADVSRRLEFDNGDVQLIAAINGGGSIVITMGHEVVFGSINNEAVSYSIGLNANQEIQLVDNQSVLSEVDLSGDMRYPPTTGAESRTAHTAHSLEDLERLSAQNTGESTIDLLVVYSSEFGSLFSSAETRINQLISFTNTSFADSGILINLRLVAAVELGFNNVNHDISYDDGIDDNGDDSVNKVFDELGDTLDDATDGVGPFTNMPSLRNQYGADLVAVLHANNQNTLSAGIAWVLGQGENPTNGVSTTMIANIGGDSVFAHEIGHNLGSVHQIGDCNGGYTGFSCGFRDNTNGWATVMSSGGNKSVIGYLFSNTDNDCLGLTCGLGGSADNRTSFNISRFVVADFRDEIEPTIPPTTPSEFDILLYLPAIIFHTIDDD